MIEQYDYVEADIEIYGVLRRERCIVYDVLYGKNNIPHGYMVINKKLKDKVYVFAKDVREIKC